MAVLNIYINLLVANKFFCSDKYLLIDVKYETVLHSLACLRLVNSNKLELLGFFSKLFSRIVFGVLIAWFMD